jgi:chromosome segregation ATPase
MSDEQFAQIDNRLDRIEAICEHTAQNLKALGDRMETLTHQMGLLTEGQTGFRADLAKLEAIVERQAATSERQERHIDRLVGIVETLVSGRAS